MKITTNWGAIVPDESPSTRLRLDFGLRAAIIAFNEWAVPGLGGAFFVRQFTWSCMGLALAQELDHAAGAAKVAEGVEALASWIALRQPGDYDRDARVQGKRKFANFKTLTFDEVRRGAYVTVPFRRPAAASLPGLGFCVRTETRFRSLELAAPGNALVAAAFEGGNARDRLVEWLAVSSKPIIRVRDDLRRALLPDAATAAERALLHTQLELDSRRANVIGLLRTHDLDLSPLMNTKGKCEFLRGISDSDHHAQLDASFAMEQVRHHALNAAQSLANPIKDRARTAAWLATLDDVKDTFTNLADSCATMAAKLRKLSKPPAEIAAFCNEQDARCSLDDRISRLGARVPLVFSLVGGKLERGIGYTDQLVDTDDDDLSKEPRDVQNGAVPRPLLRLRRLLDDITNASTHGT